MINETPTPVMWRVKDWADGWITFTDRERAMKESGVMGGAIVEALYSGEQLVAALSGRAGPMLTTEAEAKGKIMCCNNLAEWCAGTRCMGWRWFDPSGPMIGPEGKPIEQTPEPAKRRGYCGLAGKVTP